MCCLLNRGWTHHPPTRLLRPLLPRLARQKEHLLLPLQQKQQKEGLLLLAPWRADLLPSLLALPCQSRQRQRLIHLRLFRARQEVDLFLSFQGREEESLNRLLGLQARWREDPLPSLPRLLPPQARQREDLPLPTRRRQPCHHPTSCPTSPQQPCRS